MRISDRLLSCRRRFEFVAAEHNRRYCGCRADLTRVAVSVSCQSTRARLGEQWKESRCS